MIFPFEWLICQENASGAISVMSRQERETMINVLTDLGGPVPTLVIKVAETKEAAEAYAAKIRATNKLLDDTIGTLV